MLSRRELGASYPPKHPPCIFLMERQAGRGEVVDIDLNY